MVGAKDAVVNTIGMGGDTNGSTTHVPAAKDTSTHKPGTRAAPY